MLSEWYALIKALHVGTVVLTILLFLARGYWMLVDSQYLQRGWVRVVPHVVDTVLLLSALVLMVIVRQYPFVHGWLTAKIFGLIVYILLGAIALRRGRTKTVRTFAFLGALVVFTYIVSVALTRNPAGIVG